MSKNLLIREIKFSKCLKTGDEFGELGLINHNTRTATIKAKEDCLLLTLTKIQFRDLLGIFLFKKEKQKKEALTKQVNFFSSVSLISEVFKEESEEFFKKLPFLFQKKKFKKGQSIIKEGKKTKGFFIIKSGKVTIQRTICPIEKNSNQGFKCNYDQKIVLLSSKDTFGEIELFSKKASYFDYVADSPLTEVFMMTTNQFTHLLFKSRTHLLGVKQIARERSIRYLKELEDKKELRQKFYISENFPYGKVKKIRTGSLDETALQNIKKKIVYKGSQASHFIYINQVKTTLEKISRNKSISELRSKEKNFKMNLLSFDRKIAKVGNRLIGQYKHVDAISKNGFGDKEKELYAIKPFDSIKKSLDNIFGPKRNSPFLKSKKKTKKILNNYRGIKSKADFEKDITMRAKKFGLGNLDKDMNHLRKMLDLKRMERARLQRQRRVNSTKRLIAKSSKTRMVSPTNTKKSESTLPKVNSQLSPIKKPFKRRSKLFRGIDN